MFPPKQAAPGQPPQRPAAPPAQMPPGAAAQPGAAPAPQQSGLREVSNIGFNQDIQNILLSRAKALTPQEGKLLDTVITPQVVPVLLKLVPELKPLFDMLMGQGGGGPIGQPPGGGQPPGAGGGGAPQAPQQMPTPPANAVASQDPNAAEEDGEENPLARDRNASAGLVG